MYVCLFFRYFYNMNADVAELQELLNRDLPAPLPVATSAEALRRLLADYINGLINTNFEQLVYILYRVDVDEHRLKKLLAEHPQEDTGLLVADLLLERQVQKIKTREQFKNPGADTGEERW